MNQRQQQLTADAGQGSAACATGWVAAWNRFWFTASDPLPAAHSPRFSGYPIETGDTETGWLLFPLERGQATVILANAAGSQMSALPIPG